MMRLFALLFLAPAAHAAYDANGIASAHRRKSRTTHSPARSASRARTSQAADRRCDDSKIVFACHEPHHLLLEAGPGKGLRPALREPRHRALVSFEERYTAPRRPRRAPRTSSAAATTKLLWKSAAELAPAVSQSDSAALRSCRAPAPSRKRSTGTLMVLTCLRGGCVNEKDCCGGSRAFAVASAQADEIKFGRDALGSIWYVFAASFAKHIAPRCRRDQGRHSSPVAGASATRSSSTRRRPMSPSPTSAPRYGRWMATRESTKARSYGDIGRCSAALTRSSWSAC